MRVKNESEWQLFLAEIAADTAPQAEPFRDFVITWAEAAEKLIDQFGASPIKALRDQLRYTEGELGRWTVGFMGMMLIVLSTHWEPAGEPDDFYASMTPIEQNVYMDAMVVKMAQLEKQAQEEHAVAIGHEDG